jgi:antitoxin VapB
MLIFFTADIYCGIDHKETSVPSRAKLFRNGRSQAVRLPADFRFEGDEVFIRRDDATGDVILSRRPSSWDGFLKLVEGGRAADPDFLSQRERSVLDTRSDPFEGWKE